MYVLEHLPSQQNSISQLWCCRLVPGVPLDHWGWRLHKWEMITGVVVFNPPWGTGWGEGREEEEEGSRREREKEQSWCPWERYAVFIGPIILCVCLCVCVCVCVCVSGEQWRTLPWVKPARDLIVISVIDTNMFIVLLCPSGGKDSIILMCCVQFLLFGDVLCLFIMGLQRDDTGLNLWFFRVSLECKLLAKLIFNTGCFN